jgi:hypothetical protein
MEKQPKNTFLVISARRNLKMGGNLVDTYQELIKEKPMLKNY